MDKALELRGQHHVNDDQCQDQHEPDFLASIAQVARFARPGVKEPRRQIGPEHFFNAIEDGAQRHADGSAGNRRAAHPVIVLDGVGRGADLVFDDAAELNEVASGVAHVEAVQVLRFQA